MKKEGTFIGSSSRTAAKKHSPAKQKRNRRSTKKRIRRVIPEEKEYIDGMPTIKDVVAGRGGGSNSHPGNRAYWQIILPNRELYKKSQTNEDQTRVAQEIVDFTKSKSGRFLQKEKGVGEEKAPHTKKGEQGRHTSSMPGTITRRSGATTVAGGAVVGAVAVAAWGAAAAGSDGSRPREATARPRCAAVRGRCPPCCQSAS